MLYDFDKVIDRRKSDSVKYDFAGMYGKPEGLLPMWIADMDFKSPPCIADALTKKIEHGIFGYSDTREEYFAALQGWFSRRFDWRIEPEWLVTAPGIVTAIHVAIRALTAPGDSVIIQPPVYRPFSSAVAGTGRRLVVNPLVLKDGRYQIDFDDFEAKINENSVKLFILCSPHNPVGRVWSKDELELLGDICLRHGVTVISDEIHQDFVYPGHRHLVFAALKPEFREMTVTCTAPSKTFNIAGLGISNIFIADKNLREAFVREYSQTGLGQPGIMGIVACNAAYSDGEAWLEELKSYLAGNLDFLRGFIAREIPQVSLIEPEGTYLTWLDFRKLGLATDELERLTIDNAGLWLEQGIRYGEGGEGFQRVNIACPRATLERAAEGLRMAF